MKKCGIFLIYFIIFLNHAFSELNFDKVIVEDGTTSDLKAYEFSFKFENSGKETIKITKVETSCSCTIPKLEKEVYAPKETGEIKGIFNIGERTGLQEKEIIVYTNDVSQSQIKLLLRLKILNPLEITPRLVYWEKDSNIESKNIELIISDRQWKLANISCDKSKFAIKDGKVSGKYTIEVSPLSTKTSLRDVIKVELKNGRNEIKTFAIHALIK